MPCSPSVCCMKREQPGGPRGGGGVCGGGGGGGSPRPAKGPATPRDLRFAWTLIQHHGAPLLLLLLTMHRALLRVIAVAALLPLAVSFYVGPPYDSGTPQYTWTDGKPLYTCGLETCSGYDSANENSHRRRSTSYCKPQSNYTIFSDSTAAAGTDYGCVCVCGRFILCRAGSALSNQWPGAPLCTMHQCACPQVPHGHGFGVIW